MVYRNSLGLELCFFCLEGEFLFRYRLFVGFIEKSFYSFVIYLIDNEYY